jgi:putative restriction endonuclease
VDWKLLSKEGNFLQEVNCQYDSLDLAVMLYGASKVVVDFVRKESQIVHMITAISIEELKQRISNMGTWKQGKAAPYKPLTVLYALHRFEKEGKQNFSFYEVRNDLKNLLKKFSSAKKVHPEYPFIFLKNDNIWTLNSDVNKESTSKNLHQLVGGFTDEVYKALTEDTQLVKEITELILNVYFPESLHEDILNEVQAS